MSKLTGRVRISGVINDDEFRAQGEAAGDPETGEYQVHLEYEQVPRDWDPILYTDAKVGLLFQKEDDNSKNMHSLTDGNFLASGIIDLGRGNFLRNNASIKMLDNETFVADYVMHGTAKTGVLNNIDFFEETMVPFGDGVIAGMALARWKTADGNNLDAIFSTRYTLDNKSQTLTGPQLRRLDAHPRCNGSVFDCDYRGQLQALPRLVERQAPYIGHLIV